MVCEQEVVSVKIIFSIQLFFFIEINQLIGDTFIESF